MRIDVWSDIVCPWCYLGKRRLERALAEFEHADRVEVVWRSFQLDPGYPVGTREPVYQSLAKKMGLPLKQVRAMTDRVKALAAEEGLAYDFDRAVMVNTFTAHRLTHLAKAHGLGAEMHERLMRAQLCEGRVLDDPETLAELAAEVGVPADEARRVLAGDEYTREVEEDIRQARELGVTGVPFFVFDNAYGIAGAQSSEMLLQALRTVHGNATAGTTATPA